MQALKLITFAIVVSFASLTTVKAAILNVDSAGQLIGAQNVDVNGTLFNVTFRDGSCASLFDGCDSASDFSFQSESDALAATLALFDQVLIDGPDGNFDTGIDDILGCTSNLICQSFIPFSLSSSGDVQLYFVDNRVTANITTSVGIQPIDLDTIPLTSVNFVQFALVDTIAVSEPATLLLFGIGLVGLTGMRRRRIASK